MWLLKLKTSQINQYKSISVNLDNFLTSLATVIRKERTILFTVRNDSCVRELAMDFYCVKWIHSGCQYPCHDDPNSWPTYANFFAVYFFSSLSMYALWTFSSYDYYWWWCYFGSFSVLQIKNKQLNIY